MSVIASQIYQIAESEVRTVAVDFTPMLDSGELLAGTPSVTEITAGSLTLGSPAVNTAQLTLSIDGAIVTSVIGAAVQFSLSTPTQGTEHRVRVSCGTDGTPAQTLVQIVRVFGADDGT